MPDEAWCSWPIKTEQAFHLKLTEFKTSCFDLVCTVVVEQGIIEVDQCVYAHWNMQIFQTDNKNENIYCMSPLTLWYQACWHWHNLCIFLLKIKTIIYLKAKAFSWRQYVFFVDRPSSLCGTVLSLWVYRLWTETPDVRANLDYRRVPCLQSVANRCWKFRETAPLQKRIISLCL